MKKCKELEEQLQAFADGEAAAQEKSAVSAHLAECAHCRKTLRWLEAGKAAAAGVSAPVMPADLKQQLLAAASRKTRAEKPGWVRALSDFWSGSPWTAGAAVAFAAAAVVVAAHLSAQPTDELPLDAVLEAHNEYSRTLPLSTDEQVLSVLPDRLQAEEGTHEL